MNYLDSLRHTKLRQPKGLRRFIFHNTDYRTHVTARSRYVDVIETYKGKLLLRTFAYHNVKKSIKYHDIEIQEVCRRLQGEKEVILCNIENYPMSGRVVYYEGSWDIKWNYLASNHNWYFGYYDMFDYQEIIEKLNIPYCQFFNEKNNSNMIFFDYICAYMDEPKIELLVKADLSQFVHCYKKLNLKAKSLDKIFRINNYWIQYLNRLDYGDIMLIKNKKLNIKNYEELMLAKKYQHNIDPRYQRNIFKYRSLKMYRFISKLISFKEYDDYLGFCEKLGYDMTDDYILYPKDIHKKHDELMKLVEIKKDKDTEERFFNAYKENLNYVFSSKDYVIMPCERLIHLEYESEKLCHCVKTYANKYMDRQTNIFFIRNIDNVTDPYVTLELLGKKVVQCRAIHNTVPNQKVINFVNKWCKQFNLKSCFS